MNKSKHLQNSEMKRSCRGRSERFIQNRGFGERLVLLLHFSLHNEFLINTIAVLFVNKVWCNECSGAEERGLSEFDFTRVN